MLYLAGIVVVVGLAIAIFAAIRRKSRAGQLEESSCGLTLEQARHLRAQGVLTEQEFDQIKRVIIGSTMISDENRAASVKEVGRQPYNLFQRGQHS